MPIEKIIALAAALVASITLTGGPQNLKKNLRDIEIKILRECTRVDNWGNPSPWAHRNRVPSQKNHAHK
jgi:hypothetical protein